MNSKAKGKRGELELAHELAHYGFQTRRGQQYNGADGSADVVGIPGLHIECKRAEQLNIEKALQQAEDDAKEGELPAVFHRKNREGWKVTVRLKDFIWLWKRPNKGTWKRWMKHGEWMATEYCSLCGYITKDTTDYCPGCGAFMKGEPDG